MEIDIQTFSVIVSCEVRRLNENLVADGVRGR